MLQHGVLALSVLANEHNIDVLVASLDSRVGLAVNHVDVEVEFITESNVAGGNATTQAACLDVA